MSSAYRHRPLRRDAHENRERLVEAAREAFAELGIDASVEEIATRAGVGIGTLYRRFPTKDALVDAIFEEHMDELVAAAERELEAEDGWDGLVSYLTFVVHRQATDRGLNDIVGAQLQTEERVAQARSRLRPVVQKLVDNAQASGRLRGDVVYEDVSVLLWTTGRVADATRDVAPLFWQRHLALAIDGLRAAGASQLPQPPLTAAKHTAAMRQFTQQRARPTPARRPA